MPEPEIDWSIFDGYPEMTCTCRCGHVFRSHTKGVMHEGRYQHIIRKPCPACGKKNDVFSTSSDYESWSIKG